MRVISLQSAFRARRFICAGSSVQRQYRVCLPPQLVMRPVAIIVPDYKAIIEATLFMNGYQKHKALGAKLHLFFDLLNTQVRSALRTVRSHTCTCMYNLFGDLW